MALDYFTLAELRGLPDLADPAKYPDGRLTAAGEWVQGVIEREVGTSFVARPRTETLSGDDQDRDGGLRLSTAWVLEVTAVTVNGVDLVDLTEVKVKDGYVFRQPDYTSFTAWEQGRGNIVVTYDAGYTDTPPADVKEAALQGARDRVLRTSGTGISDRTTSVTNEFGNIQLAQPGKDRPTGLPEVDAVIVGWRDKLNLFGFS